MYSNIRLPWWLRCKNLPAMQEQQEIQVQYLGREDPLAKGIAPTLVFLPGDSHGQLSLAGQSIGSQSRTWLKWFSICMQKNKQSIFKKIFIYLLTWQHQVLVSACRIFSCCMLTLSCCMWNLVPWPGIECLLHWEFGVLATGPPGKSLKQSNINTR